MPHLELSPFQKEKLEYYFKFLEPNDEGILEGHSVERLMERIWKFTGWSSDCQRALQCLEIHNAFFEILFEKADEEGEEDGGRKDGTATLENWYAIWSHILPGCKGMSNFPVWLRLMPKVLFDMIDRKGDDVIDEEELFTFYKDMVNVTAPDRDLHKWTKRAFEQMTDFGRYPLNLDSYEQIFANFLIGRTPHGPGKYIFGCFSHDLESFQLIQPVADDDEDDSPLVVSPAPEKRPKKFGIAFTSPKRRF